MVQNKRTDKFAAWTVVSVGVLVFVLGGLKVTGVFDLIKGKKSGSVSSIQGSVITQTQIEPIDPNLDSDGDGLTDVVERKIGTDPNKADSDNDGYSDKQEVDSGHDPLVDEKKAAQIQASQKQDPLYVSSPGASTPGATSGDPSLSTSSTATSPSTSLSSPEGLGNLALLNTTMQNGNITLPDVSEQDLTLAATGGRSAIQQYLSALLGIFVKDAPFSGQSEFDSAFQSIQNGSTYNLDKILKSQTDAYGHIKAVPTPPEMVDLQKKILGTLQLSMDVITMLKQQHLSPDSQMGLDMVSKMQVAMINAQDIATQVQDLFVSYQLQSLL